MAHLKLVTVKANGRQYMYLNAGKGKVHVRGEVLAVGGFSTNHGDAKTFLIDKVDIHTVDLTKELLVHLLAQGKRDAKTDKPIPEPAPKVKKPKGNKWVTEDRYDGRLRLTKWAEKELVREGKGIAEDGLGNYIDGDHALQDAAYDLAMGHYDLDHAGVPAHSVIREIAADLIYEGMHIMLKKFEKQGKKVTVDRV